VFINWKQHELNLKVVYYGSALSGKTTNLQYIHAHTNPSMRGDLIMLKTQQDRTLFFDYLQLELGEIKGLRPRFSLYTVPGQAYYAATRKLVLQGVDGLVLVMDSQRHRLTENRRATRELQKHLGQMGHSLESLPLVLQCNKRDLPSALPTEVLEACLGHNGVPCIPSVATTGMGVMETLKTIITQLIRRLN
jgi:signal recognition particle receptor subunit beta